MGMASHFLTFLTIKTSFLRIHEYAKKSIRTKSTDLNGFAIFTNLCEYQIGLCNCANLQESWDSHEFTEIRTRQILIRIVSYFVNPHNFTRTRDCAIFGFRSFAEIRIPGLQRLAILRFHANQNYVKTLFCESGFV